MSGKEKADNLLSRAEVSLVGAEEVLKDRKLSELSGQIQAVNTVLSIIRRETTTSRY